MRVDVLLQLLDKTINDEAFRQAALQAPELAVREAGFELTADEWAAFTDFHLKAVQASRAPVSAGGF